MKHPIAIRCPAKVNLYLDLKGKRDDGYHEIRTVMQTVDLYDEIIIKESPREISMECDHAGLPTDERNLCWRAADALRHAAGVQRGVRIHLVKRIPIAAGLGGGSSDAAGVLRGLREMWAPDMSSRELDEIAAKIGSDIPFFLHGGTAFCTGRGETVRALPDAAAYAVIVVTPPIAVATPEVYASLDPLGAPPPVREEDFLRAVASGDPRKLGQELYNRLEANRGRHMGEVKKLKLFLMGHGALGASMSGSGPSVFGITKNLDEAQRIGRAIRKETGAGNFVHAGMTNIAAADRMR
ncbi:MAG: 4-(cytidine 5'-diphospho)-2-C-methyl-D-erythritol kinase [Candidatus Aureabacteria bacterium]|nr:4-(cytidine 5'-diphospho)-2-C-methyl-D-erythritol kinase [Candidatus Auribacterota bacterium]